MSPRAAREQQPTPLPMPRPYDRTSYGGHVVDQLTAYALMSVSRALGYPLTLLQGSYNAGGVSASAGTHDGGGVVDLPPFDHDRKVLELRRAGFAAWYRPELPGVWGAHIHAVLIGNKLLSPAARAQVDDYLAGRNGLADHGPDTGPRQFVDRRFTWQRGRQRIARTRQLLDRAEGLLASGVLGYRVGRALQAIRGARAALPAARAEPTLPPPPTPRGQR